MKQALKTGTRIEMDSAERATIARWTTVNGPVKNRVRDHGGWHIVKFADGGMLCVHESRFRIVEDHA